MLPDSTAACRPEQVADHTAEVPEHSLFPAPFGEFPGLDRLFWNQSRHLGRRQKSQSTSPSRLVPDATGTDDSLDGTFSVQSAIVPPGGGQGGNPPLVDPSLLEVLETDGGDIGENGMARQAVRALFNAASPDVNYPLTVGQVIAAVQAAYANPSSPTEGFAAAHTLFEGYNTLVTILPDGTRYHCPLN